jgi:hypothetical protein
MAELGADDEVDPPHIQHILPSNVTQPRFRYLGEPEDVRGWTAVMAPLTEPLDMARSEIAWRLSELGNIVLDLIDVIRDGAHMLAGMFPGRRPQPKHDLWSSFTAKRRSTSGADR